MMTLRLDKANYIPSITPITTRGKEKKDDVKAQKHKPKERKKNLHAVKILRISFLNELSVSKDSTTSVFSWGNF